MNNYQYIFADKDGFKNEVLDILLAAGFYRMQHLMFTCNETFIHENENPIPVFWLRTLVKEVKIGNSAKKILKRCERFSVSIKEAYINDEIETLYKIYKNHVAFQVSNTCKDYLSQEDFKLPFDARMIQVRDGKTLIATGFFDKGFQSIAGIMNIYHPQYKEFSLGKFLMLQKLQFALSHNMIYYYTGYISTQSTRFDYKVFPDEKAVEVLLPAERKWVPYHLLNKEFLSAYYNKFLVSN